MPDRKYTLDEIDRMRKALNRKWGRQHQGIPYYHQEMHSEIETELRTLIMNGSAPEEIEQFALTCEERGPWVRGGLSV
jgi:hypothetical protein